MKHDSGLPGVILLFQEGPELVTDSPDELEAGMRKTALHEVGHYFGLDENQLAGLGYG